MSPEIAFVAIQSLVSLLIIAWLLFWGLPAYRLDRYRQALFEIRDNLFDYAAQGNIDFNHPAYGMLRGTINGFIRFAHRMSFCHLVLMAILNRRYVTESRHSFAGRWEKNTNGLSPEVKQQLATFLNEVNLHTGRHALGCWADILISIIKSILVATWCGERIRRFLLGVRDNMDTTAFACGDDSSTSGLNVTTAYSVYMLSETRSLVGTKE